MTLLNTIGTGLLAADRRLALLRRTGGLMRQPMPLPTAELITLDGGATVEPTITFAGAVESNPIAWAVVTKLARELSTLGIGVFRRGDDGRLRRQHGTSLEDLLRRPLPGHGLVHLLQWLFMPALVEGNALIGKYRGDAGGRPQALVPLDWRCMSAYAHPGAPVEWWLSSQLGFDEPRVLWPSEVVHVAWQAPSGGAVGVSPLRPLADAIRLDDAARRFMRSHLRNGARPAGAIVFPADADVSEEDRTAVRDAIKSMHGGVDRAFNVALMGGGVEWRQMSFSAADAQLGDTRLSSRTEVCVSYDVRWSQIADSGTTDVGALARDLHRTLRPWAILAETALQRQLVDLEPDWRDLVVRFDFTDLLRGSPTEEANRAVHLYVNGLAGLDESRDLVDLPPVAELDETARPLVPHAQLDPAGDGRALPASTNPRAPGNRVDRGVQGD